MQMCCQTQLAENFINLFIHKTWSIGNSVNKKFDNACQELEACFMLEMFEKLCTNEIFKLEGR